MDRDRFECFPDPNGGWLIWDNDIGEPATFSQIVLVGLTGSEAESMCRLLNGYTRSRDDLLKGTGNPS